MVVREFQVLPQMKDTLRLLFCLQVAAALRVWSTSNWHQKVVSLMEAAAKETEVAHIPGGVWVWLPDRRCLVDQHVAA